MCGKNRYFLEKALTTKIPGWISFFEKALGKKFSGEKFSSGEFWRYIIDI